MDASHLSAYCANLPLGGVPFSHVSSYHIILDVPTEDVASILDLPTEDVASILDVPTEDVASILDGPQRT